MKTPEEFPSSEQQEELSQSESFDKKTIRDFTKEYSPWARQKFADELKRARIMRDLKEASPEETAEKIKKLQADFYQRFVNQKEDFENSLEQRDIRKVTKDKGVFFVHSLPVNGISRWNTGMNNQLINAQELNIEELLKNIKENSPDLSCSSVSLTERSSPHEKEKVGTMYPFGVVLGEGKILSAYRYDAGTLTEKGGSHKKSKYDPETQDTSIHSDIPNKIANVLDRKFDRYLNPETGSYNGYLNPETQSIDSKKPEGKESYRGNMTARDFDEFVISKPVLDGLYIDLDNPTLEGDWNSHIVEEINKIVHQYKKIPVYIKKNQKITIYSYGDNDSVEVIDDIENLKKLEKLDSIV